MNPLYKLIIAAGAVVVLVLGWQWRESVVYENGHAAAITERKADDDKKIAEETAKAHAKERALEQTIYDDTISRAKEKAKYETDIETLRTAARAGNSGMRAPGTCLRANPAPANPSAAGGSRVEEGFILLPATAASVLDAASDSRNDVLARNALIDLYNQARATCNAP